MIETFTALDFETAHGKRWSICGVGLVQVKKGKIIKEIELLVQPPDNRYHPMNIQIHGITPEHTATSPTFDKIWKDISKYIENQHVVAHNGFSFDFNCLKQVLEYYNLPEPEYEKHDTYRLFGAKLNELCHQYKIPLQHHNALSDARACAMIFMKGKVN